MFSSFRAWARRLTQIDARTQYLQEALGRIEARQLQQSHPSTLQEAEFRVFSQWGEDGILQYLLQKVAISRKIFVEFGVENYTEANTRFLLVNDNWAGLVIDGGQQNIDYIRNDPIYWRHNLKAECSFITRENINDLIRRNGITGDIGLLSVDIDGNDYWVWQAIDGVYPAIVVAEYNARFGPDRAVTTPYDANFVRSTAHHSNIYYGASLAALCLLGREKGYALVGCNSAGNNAFFIQQSLRPASLPELTPQQAYVACQFREARDAQGKLLFLSADEEKKLLDRLPLVDVS
jgi:hypothetical protein